MEEDRFEELNAWSEDGEEEIGRGGSDGFENLFIFILFYSFLF